MNRLIVLALAAVVMASCSAPKYTYNFDHYDYNAGKRKQTDAAVVVVPATEEKTTKEEPVLSASTSAEPVSLTHEVKKVESNSPVSYRDLSRAEKKEFRKELKNEFKKYVQAVKKGEKISATGQNSGNLDPDIKLAIIFGSVGVVLFILGGVNEVFTILGAISLLVGVYFLVKWLIRQ